MNDSSHGVRVNAAGALASPDSEVALLAPFLAPAVFDNPEVLVGGAVADHEDGVVELVAAAEEGVEDASMVELQQVGVQPDRDGSEFNELLREFAFILAQRLPIVDAYAL